MFKLWAFLSFMIVSSVAYSYSEGGKSVNHELINTEIECLAKNIYFEARSESDLSKKAVGLVTLNRVEHSSFPSNVCGVVKQAKLWRGKIIRNKCQFSWYCDGKSDRPRERAAWNDSKVLAAGMYFKKPFDVTYGATFYHADYVNPKWAKNLIPVAKIGSHKFYRMEKK